MDFTAIDFALLDSITTDEHDSPTSKSNAFGVQADETKMCVVMVGLPARGKSYIAQKLMHYLRWLSIEAETFNVGSYRRKDSPRPSAAFFDTANSEGERARKAAAEEAMNDMMKWFKKQRGAIAIFDATNSSKTRRQWIEKRCAEENIETLYVESICKDNELIMSNITEVKTTSPDYAGQDPEVAAADFKARIRNYEQSYQGMNDDQTEKELSFAKIIDVGAHVVMNKIRDYLQTRVIYYILNLHIRPRSIWLSRHGESEFNVTGQIGGDSDLSEHGQRYAKVLPDLVKKSLKGENIELTVWTSTLKRTIQTARFLPFEKREWKALEELDSGVCDSLTYKEIADKHPIDFKDRDEDKYNYRYTGGESYRDVVIRLEPIIMELERSENILIVTHQAVLRCILAYFNNDPQEKSPWKEISLHTLIKLTPHAYNTEVETFKADVPAVSTWRGKGSLPVHSTTQQ